MSGQSKLKTLYVMKLLQEESSAENVLSAADLCKILEERYSIKAERKAIYSDIDVLKEFGLDIKQQKGNNPGYYIENKSVKTPNEKPSKSEKKEITIDVPFEKPKIAFKDMSKIGSVSYLVKDKEGNSLYALKVNTDVAPFKAKVKNFEKNPDAEPVKKRLDLSKTALLSELCKKMEEI